MPKYRNMDDEDIVTTLMAGDSSKASRSAGNLSNLDEQTMARIAFWASVCEVVKDARVAEKELRDSAIRRAMKELPRVRSEHSNSVQAKSDRKWSFAADKLSFSTPFKFRTVFLAASCLLLIGAFIGLLFLERMPGSGVAVMHDGGEVTILSQNGSGSPLEPGDSSSDSRSAGVLCSLADRISQIDAGGTLLLTGEYRETLRITKPLYLTTGETGGVRIGI